MNRSLVALVSGAVLLGSLGHAGADEPARLTSEQLDGVTASGAGPSLFSLFGMKSSLVVARAEAGAVFPESGDFLVKTVAIGALFPAVTSSGSLVNVGAAYSLSLVAIE